METVTRFAERQAGSVSVVSTPGPEVAHTLSVTASYMLSEDGRKASLLSGGDGHAVQQIALHVPANRLHLVSVDKQGVARLKLRPRFERDGERGIVRIDAAPSTTRRRRSMNSIGPPRRITNWKAPTMPSASPSDRNGVMMIAPFARASPSVSWRTRNSVLSRTRRHRLRVVTSSPTAVAYCSISPRTKDWRRTFPLKRNGASVRICESGKSAIGRTERHSSRCTKRRSASSPIGFPRTGRTNRKVARPPGSCRWPRRSKRSRIMRSLPYAAGPSTGTTVLSGCRSYFETPPDLTISSLALPMFSFEALMP